METIERYIKKTNAPREVYDRYVMHSQHMQELFELYQKEGAFALMARAFEFGFSRGYRAGRKEVK